ncbi:TlpA family protein disulfide reductase [Roseateles sp. DAIF2]|nr:TlpA disulfide reductase family protein [Roseateles sp. DAIF2]QPF76461.1 TlpA family protein disulfide reductase [Roseateles sp. DAIF2]
MKRRTWVITAGAGAALLGGGLAWRQHRPAALSEPAQAFWSAAFERPEGGQLSMRELAGRPLLLNFWATWCAPCVKEMPELDQFQREFQAKGWSVLGLAVDSAAPVREFLKKLPVGFPIALAGLTGLELTRKLGNLQGGLPFSVAFDRSGEISWRKLGPTNLAELRLLGGTGG